MGKLRPLLLLVVIGIVVGCSSQAKDPMNENVKPPAPPPPSPAGGK